MKLKFTRKCKDKNSGEIYAKGKSYEFDDTRAAEILAVKVDGNAVATEVKPKKKAAANKQADKNS